jgi:hypothetical protein
MSLVCLGSRGDPHGWNARKASLSFYEDSISEVFLHLTRASMRTPAFRDADHSGSVSTTTCTCTHKSVLEKHIDKKDRSNSSESIHTTHACPACSFIQTCGRASCRVCNLIV